MKYLIILFIKLCFVTSVLAQQIEIDSVIGAFRDAIRIIYAEDSGIQVNSAGDDGVHVLNAGDDGVYIEDAEDDGVYVRNAGGTGFEVNSAGGGGVHVVSAGDDGVVVSSAGGDGFYVLIAVDDGFYVANAGDDGVHVQNAGDDGLFVNDADAWSMNIQGNKNLFAFPSNHIAQIYNRSTGTGPDVLALKVGTVTDPNDLSHFVTFFKGDDTELGRIEGNGSGGVVYGSAGADFAECLQPLSNQEDIKAGDIVGVYGGKVSLQTYNASSVMVITDRPAVLGNQREEDSDDERVSFIGQVFVNVRGQVNAGDWIVASGLEDGTGIAVSPDEITLDQQIVGRAWESNPDPGIKKINTAVGLDNSAAKDVIIRNMDKKITDLQAQIDELKSLIAGTGSE